MSSGVLQSSLVHFLGERHVHYYVKFYISIHLSCQYIRKSIWLIWFCLVTIHDQDNDSQACKLMNNPDIGIIGVSLSPFEFLSLDHCQLRRIIGICAAISTYDCQTWKYEKNDMSSFTVTLCCCQT